MYCPKCGVRNLEDARFCRSCGADLSLIPQALTGRLPVSVLEVEEQEREGRRERKVKYVKPPTFEKGMENIFIGIAFAVVFILGLLYYPGALFIWGWAIFPAFGNMGKGIGQIIAARRDSAHHLPSATASAPATASLNETRPAHLSSPDTSEIIFTPASITEGTTHKLNAPAEGRARDA